MQKPIPDYSIKTIIFGQNKKNELSKMREKDYIYHTKVLFA